MSEEHTAESGGGERSKKPSSEDKAEPRQSTGKTGGKQEGKAEGQGKKEGESKPFHPSKKAIVIAVIIVAVLVVAGILYWLHARNFVSTDDAYTIGHVHQISARVAGTVSEVDVDDNQHVQAGEVLVRLDPRDFAVALEKAHASFAQAEASITKQEAVITQAHAQVSQAAAQLERAQQDYDRIAGLYTRDIKAVSKADVDAAKAALVSAKSQAESADANTRAAEADLKVEKAKAVSEEASVHDAELQLSYCDVIAPVAGKVSKKTVESGQRLQPGEALLAIVPDEIWVIANLKETQLERVRIGQRVDVKIDTLPHYIFFGTVTGIQEGSGATFSLLPPDNATGNFTKIVQRVPVKIVFDDESVRDFRDKIVPGLSVEPTIDLLSLENNKREDKRKKTEEKQNREMEKKP